MHCTVEVIKELNPIEGADRIEVAKVGNFQTVVQKGECNVGDQVLFISADAVLPQDREWAKGYLQYAPKRVKIVKLRGVFSEGCVVPVRTVLKELGFSDEGMNAFISPYVIPSDIDWDGVMGVTHYETPQPQDQKIKVNGLPAGFKKTDAERWENVLKYDNEYIMGAMTVKIDGTSATYNYDVEKGFRVFSRKVELFPEDDNYYTRIAKKYPIENLLKELGSNYVLQGEIYGQNIQGSKQNPHSGLDLDFAAFGLWNIAEQRYHTWRDPLWNRVEEVVPVVEGVKYGIFTVQDCQEISETWDRGEGVVIWTDDGVPIKILSKKYQVKL